MSDIVGRPAPERACLRMTGADVRTVLQGVVTNDVGRLAPGHAVYAALLTPQGKYLFDFFLVDEGSGDILIDVAAERAQALAKRLKMYCLRRDARISPDAETGVALVWSRQVDPAPAAASAPAPGAGTILVADPRAPALGWRVYARDPDAVLPKIGADPSDASDYTARRVALSVPETGTDLIPDDTFILEAGFERLNGVDFRKGCYVGQEVTARMHHKTVLKKRLVPVRVEGEAEPGTPVLTAEGKPAGTLFSQADGRGLAHLRLDRAEGDLTAGAAVVRYDPSDEASAASPSR